LQRVLSTVFLLGLLLATAAAFAITEHLKLIKSPIYLPDVTKVFSPGTTKAEVSFKLRHPDSVTVTIVDSSGNTVATLSHEASEPKNALLTFRWDGHTPTGIAPNGSVYYPQVHLVSGRRTILMPNKIVIDTVPPKVLSASDEDGILVRRGTHGVAIHYVFSERAHASVYLGGRRIILGRSSLPIGKVKWNGKVGGKQLPPGRYVLEVAAVDIAGNETPPAERKRVAVRIRNIILSEGSIHVAPRARFTVTVRTAAPKYTWKLAGAHGTGTKKVLHLRAPAHHGRYRLVVSEHGHTTTATVIVGKK
jgi:hypothetical protein